MINRVVLICERFSIFHRGNVLVSHSEVTRGRTLYQAKEDESSVDSTEGHYSFVTRSQFVVCTPISALSPGSINESEKTSLNVTCHPL